MVIYKKPSKGKLYNNPISRLQHFLDLVVGGCLSIVLFLAIAFVILEVIMPQMGSRMFLMVFNQGMYATNDTGNITQSIVNICNLQEDEYDKIFCVHNLYSSHYEYKEHLTTFTINNGTFYGNCLSSSGWLCDIYKELGLNCFFVPTNTIDHTFIRVEYSEGYCNIDQQYIDCVGLGKNANKN